MIPYNLIFLLCFCEHLQMIAAHCLPFGQSVCVHTWLMNVPAAQPASPTALHPTVTLLGAFAGCCWRGQISPSLTVALLPRLCRGQEGGAYGRGG